MVVVLWASSQLVVTTASGSMECFPMLLPAPDIGTAGTERPQFSNVLSHCSTTMWSTLAIGRTTSPTAKSIPFVRMCPTVPFLLKRVAFDTGSVSVVIPVCKDVPQVLLSIQTLWDVNWPQLLLDVNLRRPPLPLKTKRKKVMPEISRAVTLEAIPDRNKAVPLLNSSDHRSLEWDLWANNHSFIWFNDMLDPNEVTFASLLQYCHKCE